MSSVPKSHKNLKWKSLDEIGLAGSFARVRKNIPGAESSNWFMSFLLRPKLWQKNRFSLDVHKLRRSRNTSSSFWWIIISLHASRWAFKQTSFSRHKNEISSAHAHLNVLRNAVLKLSLESVES